MLSIEYSMLDFEILKKREKLRTQFMHHGTEAMYVWILTVN